MKSLTTDVVVVGGGAAGLLAAVRCRQAGREVVIVEASEFAGGATATDNGRLWLPAHGVSGRAGNDSPAEALTYLDGVLGATSAASRQDRREAFVASSAALASWLQAQGLGLTPVKGRVDLYPDVAGAKRQSRVLTAVPFDTRLLGVGAEKLRPSGYTLELAPRSVRGLLTALVSVGSRTFSPTRTVVSGGAALSGRLLLTALTGGATLWLKSELLDLVESEGRVAGVRVRRDGAEVELRANDGVILACGGFEANQELRREHLPLPTDAAWTTSVPTNTGAGLQAARRLGAAVADLHQAWWTIVGLFRGRAYRLTSERSLPHGLIVDRAGDRFCNEAAPMPEGALAFYERNRRVRAIPSYLVVDGRHRQKYRLGPWLPGSTAESDGIVRAQSLSALADEAGIDEAGLLGTVVRFNGFAGKGKDLDFGRGGTQPERDHGDPSGRKNPCLGPVEKSPFWAIPVFPGDAGTKGGLVVDADARVLRPDGSAIGGLYATSGTAASIFKQTSPGVGAALASALVDAYRAATHLTA